MTTAPAAAPRSAGRLFLMLGCLLAALGIIGYAAQLSLHRLTTPWYMPAAATLGVLSVVAALWRRRTVWRVLALLLLVLLAGAEWTFLLATRLPAYAGPVAEGKPFPAFVTARADGSPFSHADLAGDKNNVMVFFRGRW